ncbi:TolC family protein [Novosphingobium sp. PASSN1]|uniref:TolC family protein n=1 Tax=Novosphingobium sp. PASSN1 TaxID=2015561 RepID=UPI000BCE8D53|nr:TolC family protein [Novosphingobium sp. PASSN1]OYU37055.1 MAG: hypothetical protein CFE35_01345 [Novosphingobium sp. PASSN1]
MRGRAVCAGLVLAASIGLAAPACGEAPLRPDPAVAAAAGQPDWWTIYRDPALDDLIARAHRANPEIAQATARVALARAAAKGGVAAQMPIAAIDASATHAQGPLINAAGGSGDLFTARLTAGWEADLFGRAAGQRAAERQDVVAADALLRGTYLLIEDETARALFLGRHLAAAAADAAHIAVLLEEARRIAARGEALGLSAPAAAEAAQRRLDAACQRESELVLARDMAWRQLGMVLGEGDAVVPRTGLGAGTQLPDIPPGVPADVLSQRPDIAAARAGMLAADERLRSERKSWLPAIGLTASGGAASPGLGQLLTSAASSFGFGLLLGLPVFDGGRHKARVAGREAQRSSAQAQYRETVLRALREVNDRLQGLQVARSGLTRAALAQQDGEVLLARSRQQAANGTLSRQAAIAIEVDGIERRIARSDAAVRALLASLDLLQALGGGWPQADGPMAQSAPSSSPAPGS